MDFERTLGAVTIFALAPASLAFIVFVAWHVYA